MSNDLDNVLSLIAATIFADKRIYASEIEAFVEITRKLKLIQRLDPKLTEVQLMAWYEDHKVDIQSQLSTPYFKDWFYDLLDKLATVPGKETVLDVMFKIAQADGEVHVSERALVTLTERYWGLN